MKKEVVLPLTLLSLLCLALFQGCNGAGPPGTTEPAMATSDAGPMAAQTSNTAVIIGSVDP